MTYLEMKRELISRIDTMTSGTSPGFSDYSYSLWLTEAQEELVSELLGEKITPTSKIAKRFDEDDLTRLGLNSLIKAVSLSIDNENALYGSSFRSNDLIITNVNVPETFNFKIRRIIGELSTIEDEDKKNQQFWRNVKVKGVSHNYFLSNVDNPFKRPNKDLIWRLIKNPGVDVNLSYETVHLKTMSIKSFLITVLSNPTPIIVANLGQRTIDGRNTPLSCELDIQYHRTIIDKAVRIAQGVLKDPQAYQIANVEENK